MYRRNNYVWQFKQYCFEAKRHRQVNNNNYCYYLITNIISLKLLRFDEIRGGMINEAS